MKFTRGLVLFLLQISIGSAFPDVKLIRSSCQRRCESSLIYSGRNSGLFCDKDCSADQCRDGCDLFPGVLSSSCAQQCTSQMKTNITGQAAAQDEMKNCNQGCVFALDEYTAIIRDTLTPLPRPTLIRESKNYSSVVLEWKEAVVDNVTLHVHKKVMETNSDWQLHDTFRYYPAPGTIHVKQLRPYMTYQFKVLVVVTPLPRHVFESPPTVPITTLPHGVPTSAPTITRLSAPSPTVVSLSWKPPTFPNGPLLGYRINLDPVGHQQLNVTTLEVPGNVTSWTFSQCQSSQLYRFSLSAWNAVGEGPSDSGNITTPNPVQQEMWNARLKLQNSAADTKTRRRKAVIPHSKSHRGGRQQCDLDPALGMVLVGFFCSVEPMTYLGVGWEVCHGKRRSELENWELTASETPYLVLGSDNKVIKINILDVNKVENLLYTASEGVKVRDTVKSQVRLFADDCLLYRETNTFRDHLQLQNDLCLLETWASDWGMKFNPKKCYILSIQQSSNYNYSLCNTPLQHVSSNPYLGIIFSNDLNVESTSTSGSSSSSSSTGAMRSLGHQQTDR
ncbi:protein sevenless-like [Babylonia areolata]|uniref:protein sevenless-like n=1 Tax=Babylonia areolata TaxID=304850 RepID=UPI003FD31FBE